MQKMVIRPTEQGITIPQQFLPTGKELELIFVEDYLVIRPKEGERLDAIDELDIDVDREGEAYIILHPTLRQTHFGKHVAIFQGKLVDEDDDLDTLWERVEMNYPDVYVWVTTVGEEPIDTIYNKTIRFEPF